MLVSALMAASAAWGVDYQPKYELIDNPKFESSDWTVATYNVLDYGVDPTGKVDCSATVQALLDAAGGVGELTDINSASKTRGWYGNTTGGIVYFPEGIYLFADGPIKIPRGVTIRGDWKKPDGNSPITGTIFKINPRRGKNTEIENNSFLILQPSTTVSNLAFWYPEQDPAKISKYPPTVIYGDQGYFGNDYCTVEHCTFVNSYTAVQYHTQTSGGCPNVFDIYGTPLGRGVQIDCIADVGRLDGMHFSAKYWENSGLDNAPSPGQIDEWLYNNATGVIMRRNDWTYTCNLDVDGYLCGFHAQPSPETALMQGNPNGHNYGFNLNNCKTGIYISGASNSSIMFTKVDMTNCETGYYMPVKVNGPLQLYNCALQGTKNAILLDENASPGFLMQECTVDGTTEILNGQITAINCTFNNDVRIDAKARILFAGNKFNKGAKLKNESLFKCVVDETPAQIKPMPEFKQEWMEIKTTHPARKALYVVTDPEFGAIPLSLFGDLNTAQDNTQAIQKALNKAKADGGGIVYLPKGHYRLDGTLTIPTGVELKGSSDMRSCPRGIGSILESYYGEGNENASAFINMEAGSGLRGITIDYPKQLTPVNPIKYPYSVRGNADTYIVNLALRTAYRGVDLFTNKCDNHYVDYISGHSFMNVIRVGNGSANGTISNIQCNTIAYACGDETKFGCWPNSEPMKDNALSAKAYGQNYEDLDFMIIGDCDGEILYNNFLFGCHRGIIFQNDGKGGANNLHALGNAVDGAIETFVFNGAASDIDLINSQVVASNQENEERYINKGRLSASFIVTGKDFDKTVSFLSGNYWGGGDCFVNAKGGRVDIICANMAASGGKHTLHAENNAKINFVNVNRRKGNKLVDVAGAFETNCGITASIIACNGTSEERFGTWDNNLPLSWEFASMDNLMPRTGWRATAFNDASGNGIARYSIDGDPSTRWSTNKTQEAGQWYAVDFGKEITFNTAILDTSTSSGDGPLGYYVEIYDSKTSSWREVARGENGASCLVISFEPCTTSKFRITQTVNGTSGYWSIHEFYVSNIENSGIEDITGDSAMLVTYANNELHFADALINNGAAVEIYNFSGSQILSASVNSEVYSLDSLTTGVYIVVVRTPDQGIIPLKIIKQ